MGDRGNIEVKDEQGSVFLYSHWGGSELPATLASALDRGIGRWTDQPYLARIIFCEMVRGDVEGETGYGISYAECDPEHPTLVVDCTERTVDGVPMVEWLAKVSA